MKRHITVLLVVGLVTGLLAPSAADAKKKKKPKPVPADVTYHIVSSGEGTCAISIDTALANPDEACSDVFWGALGEQLGTGPAVMPALDGLPLTLDAAKPIKGTINVQSWYFAGAGPDVMGIGLAELYVKLAGTSAGEEVVIGELTTDPYLVTPASADYVVEFEIQPDAALAGKIFDDLTLSLEPRGTQMFHGVIPSDGASTITLGAFTLP